MEAYDRVAKVVGPKKIALAGAESDLAIVMEQLKVKQDELQKVVDKVQALNDDLKGKQDTKAQLEAEFPGCVVPDELANGWWSPERGCETVAQALERVKGVADWLWREAKAWKPEDGAIAIVAHGMFIDILCKTLMGVPTRTGKQSSMFCTNNAGVHVFQFHVGEGADAEGGPGEGAGDIAGLLRFNVVEQFQPAEVRSGGSVVGLDECYMHEGNA